MPVLEQFALNMVKIQLAADRLIASIIVFFFLDSNGTKYYA